jgi:hypothetical protein
VTAPGNPFHLRQQLADRERLLHEVATLLDAIGIGVPLTDLPQRCRQTASLIRHHLNPGLGKASGRRQKVS